MIENIIPKLTKAERKWLAERLELAYGEGTKSCYSSLPDFMHYELSDTKVIASTIRTYDTTDGPSETTV